MPTKLSFTIVGCTGEDPEFPASELLYHSPDSRGWCTPRLCQYPQELTLRLEAAARLTQLQLLSHEFKIAGKVELVVGTFDSVPGGNPGATHTAVAAAHPSKATWRRLGFLSFDTNERSAFSARELKSVALNAVPAHLLRLIIHRCHANAANTYGQVSLVAINVMGDPMAPSPLSPITNTGLPYGATPPHGLPPHPAPGMSWGGGGPPQLPHAQQQYSMQPPGTQQYMQPPPPVQQRSSVQSPGGGAASAVAAELGVDLVTAQRIHDLQQQKQQAVDREDYDEAKRIKVCVDRLRAAGGAIAGLEGRKRVAVEEEDYDLAKQLKLEIDRMRAAAYAAALSGREDSEDALSPQRGRRTSTAAPASGSRQSEGHRGSLLGELSAVQGEGPGSEGGEGAFSPPGAASRRAEQQQQQQAAAPGGRSSPQGSWNSHDERPLQAKGAYSFQNADATSLPPNNRRTSVLGGAEVPSSSAAASAASDAGPLPAGFPKDLPSPEALSAAAAKDAGPVVDMLGEYLARCLFSRTWQLREAALAHLAKELAGGSLPGLEGGSDGLRTLTRLLLRTLRDKVAAVYSASLSTLQALVAAQAGKCSLRDLQAALAELLPVLAEKAADLNQRTKDQATETLVALAGVPEAGLRAATGPFLRAPKAGAAPKVVLGRLQLVSALLPVVGIAAEGSNEGFTLSPLMAFVGPALGNSSAEVRGAAVALTVQVALVAGPSVQRMLPADLNPKIKEQIEQGMLGAAGVALAPSSTAAAAAAAKAPLAAAATRATPAATPAPPSRSQQAPPAGGRPAASPPSTQQQAAALPRPAQQQQAAAGVRTPAAAVELGDEAAVYAAELRSREARLGPHHPDVAEAVSNLAILHNQRGDSAAALPLYERALAIWEAACGPDSPDVAHTLTDIAVIHLEQGRDDIGRPLLQRALRVQEAHLGPDHPDVMAIRDVLLEDG